MREPFKGGQKYWGATGWCIRQSFLGMRLFPSFMPSEPLLGALQTKFRSDCFAMFWKKELCKLLVA